MTTQQTLRKMVAEDNRKLLRKVKRFSDLPEKLREIIYAGMNDERVYNQFLYDLRVYGLWEALLYIANYEDKGEYKKGTAVNATECAYATFCNL